MIIQKPFVSILVLTKNCDRSIRRCLNALVRQDYPNIEIIIQDGQSTDRTLDIINNYDDKRIKLHSEYDEYGASEAFYKGLKRCGGDIITLCWADEEIFPHTVSWGIDQIEQRPDAAGIYGGVLASDLKGVVNGAGAANIRLMKFDLEKALCWEQIPNYVTSFFRRSCLVESGFFERVASYYEKKDVRTGCIMYEYFCLPALKRPIYAVPHFMGKFASHKRQLCSNPKILYDMLEQLQNSFNYLLDLNGTPSWVHEIKDRAMSGFHLMMIPNLVLFNYIDEAYDVFKKALAYNFRAEFLRGVVTHAIKHMHDGWQYEQSIKFLSLCIANDPDHLDWHFLIGLSNLRIGNYDDALVSFRFVSSRDPSDNGAHRHVISLLLKRLFKRTDVREKLSRQYCFNIDNELRFHELADKVVRLLISGKIVLSKINAIRAFNITRASKLLDYIINLTGPGPDMQELHDACIRTRYFAMACFDEFSDTQICNENRVD